MSYKVAVASTDGKNIDQRFGEAKKFLIFTVDGREASFSEIRPVPEKEISTTDTVSDGCQSCDTASAKGCGEGDGRGCGGSLGIERTVSVISDCRCIVCSKVGFQAAKQLERKAISFFDVSCPIRDALEKISFYYDRVDRHESLRKKI